MVAGLYLNVLFLVFFGRSGLYAATGLAAACEILAPLLVPVAERGTLVVGFAILPSIRARLATARFGAATGPPLIGLRLVNCRVEPRFFGIVHLCLVRGNGFEPMPTESQSGMLSH